MFKFNLVFLIVPIAFFSCKKDDAPLVPANVDVRQEMRNFVIGISKYAKGIDPEFAIIPQNGIELVTKDGEATGPLAADYLAAVDGHGQEDLFFGYDSDDEATSAADNKYLRSFLDLAKAEAKVILVTDYCSTHSRMDSSYARNGAAGYISYAADRRELDNIPTYNSPYRGENNSIITNLSQAVNFIYYINPTESVDKAKFIEKVTATHYDLLIMDLFSVDGEAFTADEIEQLRHKKNGGKRMVIAYMSIGEAEDYRYYWQSDWNHHKPAWMDKENPNWKGNYKVKYWEKTWQDIIYGNDNSYLKKILDAGFDGVYLDIIDAFEYYE